MAVTLKKPVGEAGSALPAIVVGLFAAFGGILFGYDTGTIGGILAMKAWLRIFSTGHTNPDTGLPAITASQSSAIVSILSAGTFFGSLSSFPTGDFLGRKWGLIFSTGVFTFGVILQTAATAIPLFLAGRFFAGFGVGLISALIPLYQSETSPKWIRGAIVGCYQFAITVGIFLATIVDNATHKRTDTGSYRIPIAVQFAWAIVLVAGLLFLPETPRYLIKRGRRDDALRSLARLRRLDVNHPQVLEEIAEQEANYNYELALGKATYIECFHGNIGKRLLTGCLLQSLQQLTGVNFIFYYGTTYFTSAGFQNPFIISVITGVVNVATTIPGLWAIERLGRRPILLWGAVGMFVCQYIVASVGVARGDELPANRAQIAFVCIYIFFFASTWGPAAWVVTGEIFPLKVRARCLSMTTASNWLLNWAIAYSTPYLVNSGPGNANLKSKVFYIWGTFCLVCAFFVWGLIYETKGLALEQIDELYAKVPHAWQSASFVPTVHFTELAPGENIEKGRTLADLENEARHRGGHVGTHTEGPLNEKSHEGAIANEEQTHYEHN